jgi:hypothetical protein
LVSSIPRNLQEPSIMKTTHIPAFANRFRAPLPEMVSHIPSMMSLDERKLLLNLAKHEYQGKGVIMDAGVFCGASTACLGAGLMANPAYREFVGHSPRVIQTYEYGVVNPGMITFFERHGVKGHWQVGDSFDDYLRQNIEPVDHLVDLHIGDISLAKWDGLPIEIMFLDVLKSEDIQMAIMRAFMPSLIPGGILIQQDYFIDGVPFVKLMQELLTDHFEYLGEIQSSAVFRLISPISADLFVKDPLAELSLTEMLTLLDNARNRSIDRDRQLICDLGKVRFLSALHEYTAAQELFDQLAHEYPEQFAENQRPRIKNAIRTAANRARGLKKQVGLAA